MSGARHFRTDQPTEEVRHEITDEVTAARTSQRDLQAAGNHRTAESMRQVADDALDELADLNAGTWKPKHA